MDVPTAGNGKSLNYKELLNPYMRRWKWFAFCVVVALALGYLLIRYSTPQYAVNAKIQIIQDQNGTTEMTAFRDLDLFMGGNTQVQDEVEILSSRSNLIEVVKQLGLNIKIFTKGNIHNTLIYKDPPFRVNYLIPDSLIFLAKDSFVVDIVSETEFDLTADEDSPAKRYSFGNTIESPVGDIVLLPNDMDMNKFMGREYIVNINPIGDVAQALKANIQISLTDEYSNIVSIMLNDPVEQKGIDILNALINTYNQNAISDKKAIADRTSQFINERISDIYGDLSTVDQTAEEYKSDRGIADLASQSSINLNMGATSRQQLDNASMQLNMAVSMQDIVDDQEGYELLPSNIGIDDPTIATTTARYNELVLERQRLLKSSNERNPIIVNLDQQIEGLKRNLQSSLNSMTNNLTLQVNNLSGQLSRINSRIYSAPGNERALRDIARQQQTTESLYLYLLQKREESQIAFASAAPKSKIVDRAYGVSEFPVSPKKPIIYLAAFIFGMLIPFGLIYIGQLLDDKVHNKVQIEKITGSIPVLAELPKLGKKESTLVKTGERTVLAESLRILRTNLDYLIRAKRGAGSRKHNLIYVTSSVPGEGKTLISSNLAMIYANTGKKVLLIGADIRNPKIYQFYSGKNVDQLNRPRRSTDIQGLTEFLIDRSLTSRQIINTLLANEQEIDVIYSGRIPPNPAELLMSERMHHLLEEASEKYDYVIVDTAPLMVVSDTLLISQYADIVLYVMRAGMTQLKVLDFPMKLRKEGKLPSLAFIVNNVKESNLGYGGKYGYGYGKTMKKWWKLG
ncbi:polysaccharide biosynthesis tyrosine autokinase [Robiginitalea sp. SC105]|uniref:GumC family protein n=1 Tax=Robiginitalea sp. SC105 TaxID=2762332 RepID=UPI001639B619|nr:polysaccharide biosynthesis tyrosine autokinase [Robiginitalea sp. SC105]MBC2840341.1 polysaccharide biosynthesis tyrosine autokinase [Robiginitalea sp. SC105]